MFDTIYMQKDRDSVKDFNLAETLSCLDDFGEGQRGGSQWFTGRKRDFHITIGDRNINIRGSVPKFAFGHNLITLTREQIIETFSDLSNQIKIPVNNFNVTRLDIADNYIMDYSPELYYPYLLESGRYTRLSQPHSIMYDTKHKKKIFYNKIEETKVKGYPIPVMYEGKHLLRYEFRLIGRLTKTLNISEAKVSDVYSEEVYNNLERLYIDEYRTINKLNKIDMDYNQIKTPKDYFEMKLAHYLSQEKPEILTHEIELMKAKKVFDKPEYYSRIKQKIKKLNYSGIEGASLIDELSSKIDKSHREYT